MEDFDLKTQRDARIRELEMRQKSRPRLGVKWPLALLGMVMSVYFVWQMRLDVEYLFSSEIPVEIGHEGAYVFEKLVNNRYAKLHGVSASKGAYFEEHGQKYVIVRLVQTPILVLRRTLPDEKWNPGEVPPPPSPGPWGAKGRLLRRENAGRYVQGFYSLEEASDVRPEWLLIQGELPRADVSTWFAVSAFSTLFIVSAWLLIRSFK